MIRFCLLLPLAVAVACTPLDDDTDIDDAGPDAPTDAGFDPVDECPDDVCSDGCADTIDGLCLPARIDVDTPFQVVTMNETCRGSTCTIVQTSVCDVRVDGNRVVVGGSVCFADDGSGACSEDCGGASGGACTITALAAGTWTFVVGDVEREIVVPFVREPANSSDCF